MMKPPYQLNGTKFSGTLHYKIYGHFGLDPDDVTEYDWCGNIFAAWFMLQRYEGYNAIMTEVIKEML